MPNKKGKKQAATEERRPDPKSSPESAFHIGLGSAHHAKPNVSWIASPNSASRQGAKIDTLVLHNTDNTLTSAINRFKDPHEQVSAHYIVARDGSITQMVDDSSTAWHSGNKEVNERSVGIEVVASKTATGMSAAQEASLVTLCRYILDVYAIKLNRILPHRAIKSTDCPGWVWRTDLELTTWITQKLSS